MQSSISAGITFVMTEKSISYSNIQDDRFAEKNVETALFFEMGNIRLLLELWFLVSPAMKAVFDYCSDVSSII